MTHKAHVVASTLVALGFGITAIGLGIAAIVIAKPPHVPFDNWSLAVDVDADGYYQPSADDLRVYNAMWDAGCRGPNCEPGRLCGPAVVAMLHKKRMEPEIDCVYDGGSVKECHACP